MQFGINIYKGKKTQIEFENINGLLLPQTIEECYLHDGNGPIPSKRDEFGKWEVRGHRDRLLKYSYDTLSTLAFVMEGEDVKNCTTTRIPSLYSSSDLEVLVKLAKLNKKLGSSEVVYNMKHIWSEVGDAGSTKIIKRDTSFQNDPINLILSGPVFFISNPLAKTPRRNCKSKGDYDVIDLSTISENYTTRVNFIPNLETEIYKSKLPFVTWTNTNLHTDYFRCFLRVRVSSESERSLICSIQPPDIAHIESIYSISFKNELDLLNGAALWSSLPLDYVVRSSGVDAVRPNYFSTLPWKKLSETALHRILQLNCLTSWYAPLWNRNASILAVDNWSDNRLSLMMEGPNHVTKTWSHMCGLRSDFSRRQALLEIDVLVAIALGLDLDDLYYIYEIQFPITNLYDKETYFDQNGRIVFTVSKNLDKVGLERDNLGEL